MAASNLGILLVSSHLHNGQKRVANTVPIDSGIKKSLA
jgi:hypothetical protein